MGSCNLGSPSGGGLLVVFTPHNDGPFGRVMSRYGGRKRSFHGGDRVYILEPIDQVRTGGDLVVRMLLLLCGPNQHYQLVNCLNTSHIHRTTSAHSP